MSKAFGGEKKGIECLDFGRPAKGATSRTRGTLWTDAPLIHAVAKGSAADS